MSLKDEQYAALLKTKDFLRLMMSPDRPKKAKEIKLLAYSCLRHFPRLEENGKPVFSDDEIKNYN